MGMGKPIPPTLPSPEEYTVEFDGTDDPKHPYNWSLSTKYVVSIDSLSGRDTDSPSSKQDFSFRFWSAAGLLLSHSPAPSSHPRSTAQAKNLASGRWSGR